MTIKPVRDFVAVIKEESQKRTSSGIYVPDVIENNVITGKVVAVGSGHVNDNGSITPLEVTVGDKIIFGRQSSVELKVEDQTYLMLREDGIICKLSE